MRAVILAGGMGKRLAPYTTVLPKPLMPVGEYPILEILLRQLARHGFTRIDIAVGYLSHLIRAYCGDGSRFGVRLDYSLEEAPLGTAGPLTLIRGLDDTFLVMNGDLLTTADYRELITTHRERGAAMTIAIHKLRYQLPLGYVVADSEGMVNDYIEKPVHLFDVSMGLYAMEPSVLSYLPAGEPFDIPNLVRRLVEAGERVCTYVSDAFWLDIGRPEDYEKALQLFDTMRDQLI